MQTQSHLLITAAAILPLRRWPGSVFAPALLVGAVLPDIPFFLLTVAGEIYYRLLAPPPPTASIMEYLHFTLFYIHPLWIVSHNFFHSLVIDSTLLLVGLWWWKRLGSRWGMMTFWLALSMLVHVVIDIFTHRSDGPLIWFPLDWSYRFASPISYWESAYGGQVFAAFEAALDLILIAYLLVAFRPVILQRWRRRT
jgi:membrane-bound metal-dependent hydrolase YbcI (DUF457 family)